MTSIGICIFAGGVFLAALSRSSQGLLGLLLMFAGLVIVAMGLAP